MELAQKSLTSVYGNLARHPGDMTFPNILHRSSLTCKCVFFKKSSLITRLKPSGVITETITWEKANCHLVVLSSSKITEARVSKARAPFDGIVSSKHTGLYYWSGNSMNLINFNWYNDAMSGSKVKEKISNQALWISSCVQNTWTKAMDLVKQK